ncbi:alpha/beta hydrolase family protein [Leadbettera azotonutricia ZAS-9]|uniref:Alpha/beta hydrolase family protein n=2 Tax=Leadbettera azotonutricia TaxID=150829 RepID=F5YE52_LEAAZ|nr:alpha/beta hydrolase family protein [Leadbettera azotonutricia ZAS-9]
MDDGVRLFTRRWETAANGPKAVLHIVHGMSEHSLRYERLAKRLAAEGIEVWAADMRGYGGTAANKSNDPGKGGLQGHCADKDSFNRVTQDVDIINRAILKERPGVPLFLMGHSWGSFISQNYIETLGGKYPGVADAVRLSGCMLSGTRGPAGAVLVFGLPFMSLLAILKGSRNGSKLARTLADGSYNKPFRPNRTNFDWLSRDEKEVDAYVDDPLCGNLCSTGFYRDLMRLLKRIHRPEALQGIRQDLPVYVFSGSSDPVGEMGKSPTVLVNLYRALGIKDLEFVLYPDARHETLNETNREEVTESLLSWLLRHCGNSN